MTDQQEPEIRATADLSPVSPSPVHTAATLAIPTLQDTADTIEAMVDAVTDASTVVPEPSLDPTNEMALDDFVDDDSFDDAYAQETDPPLPALIDPALQDTNDDYAKMFDSPVGSDAHHDSPDASVDVSSVAQDSTRCHIQPVQPVQPTQEQNIASSASVSASGHTPSHSTPADPAPAPALQSAAHTPAGHDAHVQPVEAVKVTEAPPSDAHSDVQPQASAVEPTASSNSHTDEARANASPAATQPDIQKGLAGGNASPSLASSSSLPPRPPVSEAVVQSYNQISAQESHHAPPLHPTAAPLGSSTDAAAASLPPIPQVSRDISAAVPNTTNSTSAPHNSTRDEFQRLWDQFMADERQYMSEAKWDRFPEGSRLFIGKLLPFCVAHLSLRIC